MKYRTGSIACAVGALFLLAVSIPAKASFVSDSFSIAHGNLPTRALTRLPKGAAFKEAILIPTPEPGSLTLLGAGLLGIAVLGRRKFRR